MYCLSSSCVWKLEHFERVYTLFVIWFSKFSRCLLATASSKHLGGTTFANRTPPIGAVENLWCAREPESHQTHPGCEAERTRTWPIQGTDIGNSFTFTYSYYFQSKREQFPPELCSCAHLCTWKESRRWSISPPILKNDSKERVNFRLPTESSCQSELHVSVWIGLRVSHLPGGQQQPGGSAHWWDYAENRRRRGRWALPRLHPRRRVASAEGLRLVTGARSVSRGQRAEKQTSRQTAHERVYGLGASGAQEAGGPVSSSAQRRAQQDFGQTVAVGTESHCVTTR